MLDPPAVVGAEVEAIMGDSHEREKGFCAGQCCSDDKKTLSTKKQRDTGSICQEKSEISPGVV